MLHAQHFYQEAIQDATCSSRLTSVPSAYVNWLSFFSTVADATVSPARNVLSIVLLVIEFFSFVRTKAAPLPGFTCKCSARQRSICELCMLHARFITGLYCSEPLCMTIAAAGKFTHDSIWGTIHFYHCARPKVVGRDVSSSSCLTYSPPVLYLQQHESVMDSRHAPHCGPAWKAATYTLTLNGRLANTACPPIWWQLLQ